MWKALNEGVNVGSNSSLLYQCLVHFTMTTISYVVCNAPVEEDGVLRHPAQLSPPPPQSNCLSGTSMTVTLYQQCIHPANTAVHVEGAHREVGVIQQHCPSVGGVEPLQQSEYGRLAGSTWPHQR